MFDSLVLHPHTKELAERIVAAPSHALLLVGADGIGKGTLAAHIVSEIIGVPRKKLTDSHQIKWCAPTDKEKSISIETVRGLQQFVRLKTTGTATLRRAIVIEHAGTMTTEAQNAFLKLLEEPPADTIIVMTSAHDHDLLPTIRSRVQQLAVMPPSRESLVTYFKAYPSAHVTQAYFLSGGLPGLMAALLDGDQDHPLFTSVALAKQLLQSSTFDRLLLAESSSKDRVQAQSLCEALNRIAQAGIKQSAEKTDEKRLKQWYKILRETSKAQEALSYNANTKLVLSNLLLQL